MAIFLGAIFKGKGQLGEMLCMIVVVVVVEVEVVVVVICYQLFTYQKQAVPECKNDKMRYTIYKKQVNP